MTARLGITHVVENLARGGLERMVVDLARTQLEDGRSVQVICLFDRDLLADEPEAGGIPVHACDKRGGADIGALMRLRRRLRAGQHGVLRRHRRRRRRRDRHARAQRPAGPRGRSGGLCDGVARSAGRRCARGRLGGHSRAWAEVAASLQAMKTRYARLYGLAA